MGFSDIAFDYIHDNGLVEETFYPYHAQDQKCDNETLHHHKKFFIKSYNIIPFNSTDELIMEAIHNFGPVSAAINADSPVFRHYSYVFVIFDYLYITLKFFVCLDQE